MLVQSLVYKSPRGTRSGGCAERKRTDGGKSKQE